MRRSWVVAVVLALAWPASAPAWPVIPDGSTSGRVPAYEGAPATPVAFPAPPAPQHPFLAANGFNNIHNDAWMTDANQGEGPVGRSPRVRSALYAGECGSVTFDSRGRVVSVCVRLDRPSLTVMDPVTLAPIATHDLPAKRRTNLGGLTDVSGGGYFYLDDRDRAVIPTADRRLRIVAVGQRLRRVRDLGLGLDVGDKVVAAMPDWSGRIWFVTTSGVVGTVDEADGAVRRTTLGEGITNSIAVDADGSVFLVTDKALYRMRADAQGAPAVIWRAQYPSIGRRKTGQFDSGSGTTPTILPGGLVTITDNADPMDVVVYRIADGGELCRVPVFGAGASATDNSLIAADRTIVVANNAGYQGPLGAFTLRRTTPGVARIDLNAARDGCHLVWTAPVTYPSSVNKLSLANGLVYGVEREIVAGTEAWSLTAVDVRTGARVWRRLLGAGAGFNNNYAPVTLGPDGSAYIGALLGIVRVADSP
ncbi:MAG: hypothetical protein JHC95_05815 [Solirubrobacteraceae bacterium]|nr:hypothetical protein [Solirubrobacteraceae bacterium]